MTPVPASQTRTVEGQVVVRTHVLVDASMIESDITAAVGERVFLCDGNDKQVGTIVSYENGLFDVMVCNNDNLVHEANHSMKWAGGETLYSVDPSRLQRDMTFTTKDACEEFVKPYLHRCRTSLVEALDINNPNTMRTKDEEGPLRGARCRLFALALHGSL